MYEAGKPDKEEAGQALRPLRLRHDDVLRVRGRRTPGWTVVPSDNDNYVKLGQTDKLVDGSDAPGGGPPDFAYIGTTRRGRRHSSWIRAAIWGTGACNVHAEVQPAEPRRDRGGRQPAARRRHRLPEPHADPQTDRSTHRRPPTPTEAPSAPPTEAPTPSPPSSSPRPAQRGAVGVRAEQRGEPPAAWRHRPRPARARPAPACGRPLAASPVGLRQRGAVRLVDALRARSPARAASRLRATARRGAEPPRACRRPRAWHRPRSSSRRERDPQRERSPSGSVEPTESREPVGSVAPEPTPPPLIVAKVDDKGTSARDDDRLVGGAEFEVRVDDGDGSTSPTATTARDRRPRLAQGVCGRTRPGAPATTGSRRSSRRTAWTTADAMLVKYRIPKLPQRLLRGGRQEGMPAGHGRHRRLHSRGDHRLADRCPADREPPGAACHRHGPLASDPTPRTDVVWLLLVVVGAAWPPRTSSGRRPGGGPSRRRVAGDPPAPRAATVTGCDHKPTAAMARAVPSGSAPCRPSPARS